MCEEKFQVEELKVINKDQEGQTLKLGDVTPGLTPHISNKYKNSNFGMPKPPHSNHLDYQVSKHSYMAIKKHFTGGNPVVLFYFYLCPLAITRDFIFLFCYWSFNKV
jgi:hypothetical protein